jgi:hypothetical protein
MKTPERKLFRCAIYTRKSTEHNLDLAFNSLDAQREACEAYIKSQAPERWRQSPTTMTTAACRGPPSTARPCRASWPMSGPAGSTSWWSTRSTG